MRNHGTNACYVWGPQDGPGPGCRCQPCRDARAAYERERASRIAPTLVDAEPIREHVAHLMASGVGIKTIAKRAGVAQGTMWKLIYGKPGRGPSQRVRLDTAERLLAVNAAMAADGARVPAERTWRHIETLTGRGWTKVDIARAIGQQGPGLQLGRRYVTAANARAIAALLDQPVPPRNLGRAGYVESTWDPEAEQRDAARRAANAEARREYRAQARERDAAPFDLELPDLFTGAGEWMRRGACRLPNVPTWIFFATTDRKAVAAAKAVCASCPVAAECLAAGKDEDGIWGGLTERERHALDRQAIAS